jgi:hypothetical protein
MRNVRKMTLRLCLLMLGLLAFNSNTTAQTISPRLFGVNAWMSDTIGDYNNCIDPPCLRRGKVHKQWKKIQDSKATFVRYGGIGPDKNMPTRYQYIRMIDSIRAKGMEPLIQVPYYNGRYTAAQAADIVNYVNNVMHRDVKYWIIGNEPNLIYNYTTGAQVAAYIKPFATAMKLKDPSIKIVGPEFASFKQTMTNELTTPGGAYDITGKDANGNYYIDVFTFHTYPMHDGLSPRSALLTKLTAAGSYQDDISYLANRLSACNTYHNRTGTNKVTMGITEINVNYTNAPTDDLYGVGANSFIGAQFVAEMYGIGMKKGVDFINLWSVVEGGNSVEDNCGYIDPSTGNKKPLYYHFQMMAGNMKGSNANVVSNKANVKAFASKSTQQIAVMIMNEELTTNYNYAIRLDNSTVTGTEALKLQVDANVLVQHTGTIKPQSSIMLIFGVDGTLLKKIEYDIYTHAANNLPPAVTNYTTTGIEDSEAAVSDMNVYPNPNNGKFTVAVEKGPNAQKEFKIELVNLIGQTVYSKKSEFTDGKEEIELNDAFAQGIYILSVKQGENVTTKKLLINKK